jgi:hypothetical protein
MPFPPRALPEELISELSTFLSRNDFVDLYRSYSWDSDAFESGFPNILRLEAQLKKSDLGRGISLQDVRDVAIWGRLRNPARIAGNHIVLPKNTLHTNNGNPTEILRLQPISPLCTLEENITSGIGPTYLSKVLRFGLPQEYGALDSRGVRIFGKGDPHSQRHNWLALSVRNDGYGWYIPKTQAKWPSAYGIWIDIIRFFTEKLPHNCPHPQGFVDSALRLENKWTCADVEMVLFTYASQFT